MFRSRIALVGGMGLVALTVLAVPVPSFADITLTVVSKAGQRQTGHNLWYRSDRREVTLRTSPSEEPRLPVDQVAYVDFGGTADVDPKLSGSQEAAVLRSGAILKGQVIELGHTNRGDENSPYLVVFKVDGGEERRLNASEVARVYFAGSSTSQTVSETPSTPAQGISVLAQQQWTPTGIVVARGDWVTFNSTGEIRIGAPGNPTVPTAGLSGQVAPGAPLQAAPAGALIGKVGGGPAFLIGNQQRVLMTVAGQLFLGANDGNLGDNEGTFQVTVQKEAGSGRR